jgi:DNA-binding response OmpR family regulator
LVVEDDPSLADVLRRGLAESGHVVDVEPDGAGGERAALGGRYDAIVLDVMLPGKDGLGLARALRAAGDELSALYDRLQAQATLELEVSE